MFVWLSRDARVLSLEDKLDRVERKRDDDNDDDWADCGSLGMDKRSCNDDDDNDDDDDDDDDDDADASTCCCWLS